MTAYIIFGLSLIIFFLFHSLLANTTVKNKLQKTLIPFSYYRILYNLVSVALFIPIAYIYMVSDKQLLFQPTDLIKILGLFLIASGIYLWKSSFIHYSLSEFIGLDRFSKKSSATSEIIITGLNKWVRHPLYSISYVVLTGVFLIQPHPFVLEFAVVMSVYLPIGIYYEEKKLIEEFGQKYVSYKKMTPAIFPDVKRFLIRKTKSN